MILVTGSEGLVGRHLTPLLQRRGLATRGFDIRCSAAQDIRDPDAVAAALHGVAGVVHLAALSRVLWAERDPALCRAINVDALRQLIGLCAESPHRPWLLFASSREVYGEPARLPVSEDAPLRPLNAYGHSKLDGERLIEEARSIGLNAGVCRLSNVFGCPHDHADRVAMAFAGAAATGGEIRVEGSENTFDFTYVHDIVEGLADLVEAMISGDVLPPIHFVSGTPTTLGELAALAASMAADGVEITEAPARTFDVSRFVGDPERARRLLGWRARTPVEVGLRALVSLIGGLPVKDGHRREPAHGHSA